MQMTNDHGESQALAIPALLKSLRQMTDLSIRDMAGRLNLAPSTYVYYEKRYKGSYLPEGVVGELLVMAAQVDLPVAAIFALARPKSVSGRARRKQAEDANLPFASMLTASRYAARWLGVAWRDDFEDQMILEAEFCLAIRDAGGILTDAETIERELLGAMLLHICATAPCPPTRSGEGSVPVVLPHPGDLDGRFDLDRNLVIKWVSPPSEWKDRADLYGIVLLDRLMSPKYKVGDIIFVDPTLWPCLGDDAIVVLKEESIAAGECASLGQLIHFDDESISIQYLNPRIVRTFQRADVSALGGVIGKPLTPTGIDEAFLL